MAIITKKFYIYDETAAAWIGETSFSIAEGEGLSSNLVSAIQIAFSGRISGQSARFNDDVREELFVLMDTRRQVVAPVINSIIEGVTTYYYSNAINNDKLPPNMFSTTTLGNTGDMVYSGYYRFCVSDNDSNNNYFRFRCGQQGFELETIRYNNINTSISSAVRQAFSEIISIFTNINTPTMGVVKKCSDNILVGVKISASNGNLNCQYGALSATESAAFMNVYNLAGNIPISTDYTITYMLENCTGDSENPTTIPPSAVITEIHLTADNGAAFNSGSVYIEGTGITEDDPVLFTWDFETGVLRVGAVTSNIIVHVSASVDPYADLQISGETDIPDADTITLPALPTLSAISSGVLGLFNPTLAQMRLLADYMWTDFGGQGQTEVDVLKEIVQAIKRTIANPLDYIFGLNIIPSQGLSVGAATEIRFGFTNTGVSMPRLTSQFFTVNCGTLSFDTLCGDTFLDYAPYSKFSIYLPYIGIKDVNANDFVGHTIGVVYHGDVVTGGITAYITKDGSVMYQYSGCCALNLPLSTDSWGTVLSGAVQVATALVAGGVSGGAAGVGEAAMAGAANVAANPSLLSPNVARSGAISGAAGAMGVQTPYIIREVVRFHSTEKFNTVTGYPSYYYRSLSSVHGYTKVYDVHLRNIGGTENEIKEIESLLKSGVIL